MQLVDRPCRPACLVLPLCVLLLLAGCAKTSMTSLLNPAAPPSVYEHILVYFPLSDLELRQVVESEFSREDDSGRFKPAHLVLFPGQEYSTEQLQQILGRERIQAVLVLSLADAGSNPAHIPQYSNTTCTIWSSSQGCTQARTTTTGGYSVDKPWASFNSTLYDLETGAAVWVATAQSRGNAFADSEDLLRSLARKSVEQLKKDGVIR